MSKKTSKCPKIAKYVKRDLESMHNEIAEMFLGRVCMCVCVCVCVCACVCVSFNRSRSLFDIFPGLFRHT